MVLFICKRICLRLLPSIRLYWSLSCVWVNIFNYHYQLGWALTSHWFRVCYMSTWSTWCDDIEKLSEMINRSSLDIDFDWSLHWTRYHFSFFLDSRVCLFCKFKGRFIGTCICLMKSDTDCHFKVHWVYLHTLWYFKIIFKIMS